MSIYRSKQMRQQKKTLPLETIIHITILEERLQFLSEVVKEIDKKTLGSWDVARIVLLIFAAFGTGIGTSIAIIQHVA